MRRSYLFVYSGDVGTRDELRTFIDSVPEILNWKIDLPSSFYLVSELSADEIARKIRSFTGEKGRFLVCEIGSNKQGWLLKDSWKMINEKTLPG